MADWLKNQGVSTVLLLVIVYVLGHLAMHGVPVIVSQIQAGYDKNAADHHEIAETYTEAAKVQSDAFVKMAEQMKDNRDSTIRMMAELVKRSDLTSHELTEAINKGLSKPDNK